VRRARAGRRLLRRATQEADSGRDDMLGYVITGMACDPNGDPGG
jgi:hypothetical protein